MTRIITDKDRTRQRRFTFRPDFIRAIRDIRGKKLRLARRQHPKCVAQRSLTASLKERINNGALEGEKSSQKNIVINVC